jgi:hypothetical protein
VAKLTVQRHSRSSALGSSAEGQLRGKLYNKNTLKPYIIEVLSQLKDIPLYLEVLKTLSWDVVL